nr:immunoglobulin light chain junction region [Macaca mulatta]MOW73357.1 immunoglobulin light chain junction region [Macaca mulatta]MOW73423.1 immunoglobulin light chain junction region [Macaca mulatta]MOW73522.1 immunoglobulin light chain junction region [Macaca mulatta]MOW73710.1 immunoglobulin light chain junction region [Macaca mulatta]
CQHSFDPPYSF